ncbi:MAG: choice-of-anchor O protein [Desulforhopalus sp.]
MKLDALKCTLLASSMVLAGLPGNGAFADDGQRLVRSVSSAPGITENPEPEGEHAFIKFMNFHVPSQAANGELVMIDYYNADDVLVKTEEKAKPLINAYIYGPVITFDNPEASGYPGHGRRDAFVAVSLDDGETWKRTNLSNSADQSSFTVSTPLQDPGAAVVESSIEFDPNGPVIEEAGFKLKRRGGKLEVEGTTGLNRKKRVEIRNAVTQDVLFTIRSDREGEFEKERRLAFAPCLVQAGVDGVFGPAVAVEDAPENCVGPDVPTVPMITEYPGDVRNIFHAVAGNKVLVAWHSKFCRAGSPVWSDEFPRDEVAAYLDIDTTRDLYLTDMFGVAGEQGATDYVDNEPVGEVPYSCLWSARGVLREDPEIEGTTQVVWFQAERLTSGHRDVNRVETSCIAGAGCAITWQEDPEGIRPGEGEGPGTGWSGATAASKTDIWYSFIRWEDFDIIEDDAGDPVPLSTNLLDTGRPAPYVPMMSAVRLTNNDRCQTDAAEGFCSGSATDYGLKDQCVGTINVPLGQSGTQDICVVDSNKSSIMDAGDLPNLANTAATRPRLNLQPRDSDGDGVVDDAWVVVVSEEDKGLGRYGYINTEEWELGNLTDTAEQMCIDPPNNPDETTGCQKADIGKNVFWASFNMGSPQTSAGTEDFSLVNNLLAQGAQLNQPEVNWRTGTYYPPMSTGNMWDFGELNFLIFNTEIARRTSMMSQPVGKAIASGGNLVAMPLWKQGTVNQGGPADISTRRIVAPEDVDETTENPYAAGNIVCAWYDGEGNETKGVMYFTDETNGGFNPYYPDGLCMAAPINLSARTPLACEASSGESDGLCPGVSDMTCVVDPVFGQLCKSVNNPEDNQVLDKMVSWYECPGSNGKMIGGTGAVMPACGIEADSLLIGSNLDDASWYNPMEVAKAHRGFLDGDYISLIYAWSPNWKLNAVGNDRYELYTRRSFDGGITWTTTPGNFVASNGFSYSGNGTTTCETWRDGDGALTDSHVCTQYGAGEAEQSRNVSQLKSMKNTILDPRYTAAGGIPPKAVPAAGDLEWAIFEPIDPTDYLDPSRNFVVFEDGDNTTVSEGEAEPLNLAYGRAEVWGDHFTVWAEIDTGFSNGIADCYPNNPHGDPDVSWAAGTGFCNEFDTLEGKKDELSEEASITASPYGDFLYGAWGQFNVDENGEFIDGDSMFRRIWFLDGYISTDNSWTLPGTNQ